MRQNAVYLDANAGLPVKPAVAQKLIENLSPSLQDIPQGNFSPSLGNPSSVHQFGRSSAKILRESRKEILKSLGSGSNQFLFCSSGSEANQWVITSFLKQASSQGPNQSAISSRWVSTKTEHPSVGHFVGRGLASFLIPVDEHGIFDFLSLRKYLNSHADDTPTLVSLLWVNNETGVIQDLNGAVRELAIEFPKVLWHIDAAQAWGKLPLQDYVLDWIDFLTVSGHKIGALAGTGGVVVSSRGLSLLKGHPLMPGHQEMGARAGTENRLGLLSLQAAAENLANDYSALELLRDDMESHIKQAIPGLRITGESSPRVANTSHWVLPRGSSQSMVASLDLEGFAVSAGSACASGTHQPSPVLLAMGRSKEEALAGIRVSLTGSESPEVIGRFVQTCQQVWNRIQALEPI